ncbi:hypothetical protein DRE_00260 [Drechslerella stenobrocha 248]|uniref:Probable aspartic-type endopeptidase OPSB n=1 Tax=Drechslerella stenobrocha 248 TaxID=1043628 RepID=W7II39_9PEZI|nr:hypothetical protein DRE_00260 [Drechslerella stenobrocha 248]
MTRAAALLLAGLAAGPSLVASASDIFARSASDGHVLAVNFQKERTTHPGHRKRDTVFAKLDNEYLLYYVDVKVGTPPQDIRLQIDTGSSDVWAPSSNSAFCRSKKNQCKEGSYNASKSSTRQLVSRNGFKISYLDGSHAEGDFISEAFTIGNITVKDMQIGVGLDTDIDAGILGIGYPANSVSEEMYPGLVDQLVSHGYIKAKAYSLYLNDQEANTGSILFGGIDTEKFQGNLTGLPIQLERDRTVPTEFTVALTSVALSIEGRQEEVISSNALPAVLDSGSSLTYLPNSTVAAIVKNFDGYWDPNLKSYIVPCSLSNNHNDFVTYRFGGSKGPEIRVALEELTNYILDVNGDIWTDVNNNPQCIFGIQPQPADFGDTYIFGDTFLRSAYVVYDLDGNKIWLAQTIFNATKSRILEIQKSSSSRSGVPNASGVASLVSARPTSTALHKPRPTAVTLAKTGTASSANPEETTASGDAPAETNSNTRSNFGLRVEADKLFSFLAVALACMLSIFI